MGIDNTCHTNAQWQPVPFVFFAREILCKNIINREDDQRKKHSRRILAQGCSEVNIDNSIQRKCIKG